MTDNTADPDPGPYGMFVAGFDEPWLSTRERQLGSEVVDCPDGDRCVEVWSVVVKPPGRIHLSRNRTRRLSGRCARHAGTICGRPAAGIIPADDDPTTICKTCQGEARRTLRWRHDGTVLVDAAAGRIELDSPGPDGRAETDAWWTALGFTPDDPRPRPDPPLTLADYDAIAEAMAAAHEADLEARTPTRLAVREVDVELVEVSGGKVHLDGQAGWGLSCASHVEPPPSARPHRPAGSASLRWTPTPWTTRSPRMSRSPSCSPGWAPTGLPPAGCPVGPGQRGDQQDPHGRAADVRLRHRPQGGRARQRSAVWVGRADQAPRAGWPVRWPAVNVVLAHKGAGR